LKTFRADLHVHTVLSPCAGVEMIPPLIVEEALRREIGLIAITDHNATANVAAVQQAAGESGLVVLPGMELQTREEVHVLCLFDTLEQAAALQAWVDARLPALPNNPDFFGEQFVVDRTGDFLRREERLLLNSVEVTLAEAWQVVDNLGGLFIPAHVDRQAFGLLTVLGFVPSDVPFEALELSRRLSPEKAALKFPHIVRFPLIQDGDVHYLDDFAGSTTWTVAAPTVGELRKAIRGEDGRLFSVKA
jgi:PHP family Zn ribbon phosphoesterase